MRCSPGSSSPRYQMLVMNPGFFMPYTVRVIRYKSNNKSYRFKDLQRIALYILVNLTVSGKALLPSLCPLIEATMSGSFTRLYRLPQNVLRAIWLLAHSLIGIRTSRLVVGSSTVTTRLIPASLHNIGTRIYLFELPMPDDSKSQSRQSGAVPLPLYRLEFHTPVPVQRTA